MADFVYCLNSSTIRPTPILDKIRIAGTTGYQAIELWHDDIDAYVKSGGEVSDIKKALDDHQLQVPTTIYLKGWFETTGEEHRQALDECKRRMQQAVAVGAEYIIAGPPAGHADYALGAKNYRELLEIGLEIGVKPAMEFLGFVEDLNTIEDALRVVKAAGHPAGTVVLDPFHIFRGGGSVESISLLTASQIAISHFNDTPSSPPRLEQHDKNRVMPGEGHLNLKRYLKLLKQTGYNRCLSLELFSERHWAENPETVARVGLERMRVVAEEDSATE